MPVLLSAWVTGAAGFVGSALARRFLFLSSCKVYGEQSPGRALTAGDSPAPSDGYARSKLAAERALAEVAAPSGLPIVINAAHPDATSTPRLVRGVRRGLGRAARLCPMPPSLLEAVAACAGQGERARRLTRSFELDVTATQRQVGWSAATSPEDAACEVGRAWREGRR